MENRLEEILKDCIRKSVKVNSGNGWTSAELNQDGIAETKQALQSYIDTKIIEARIDELQQLAQEIGPARNKESWEDWAWRTHKAMADRIKALNHRKDD